MIKTDHEALKYFMEQKLTTILQQKWLSKMLGFDYVISYKKGRDNVAADALSRVYENKIECAGTLVNNLGWKEELRTSLEGGTEVSDLMAQLSITGTLPEEYDIKCNTLMKDGKYYVGSGQELRKKITMTLHDSSEGGHSGVTATIKGWRTNSFGQV